VKRVTTRAGGHAGGTYWNVTVNDTSPPAAPAGPPGPPGPGAGDGAGVGGGPAGAGVGPEGIGAALPAGQVLPQLLAELDENNG
jgi:hypothetical protein